MTASFGKNQGVANTLDTYLQQDKPRFAILLQGKWGSGKTWFIRNYIEKNKSGRYQFCYVSLFGINQLKEIDSQIIACCNPNLSKAAGLTRLAGAIIERCNPIIKGNDIEKIGEFVKKLCKISENLVLILDDLERSSVSLELVLGYVSTMLDEVGIKVILLCDPKQISDENEKFLRFKEKIVGSSIAVQPDAKAVIDFQVESIGNLEIKRIFSDNKSSLLRDFNSSKTYNLRNVKRIIYEFSICHKNMTAEMKKNKSYLADFLHTLFIFSIEINRGLSIDEYHQKKTKIYTYYEFPQHYSDISQVPKSTKWDAPIPSEFLEKFFYEGIVDEKLLCDAYADSGYTKIVEIPLLIHHLFATRNLDDTEAVELYEKLKIDLKNFRYTEPSIILHAFDIMLQFSQIGLESLPGEEIIHLAKEYISKAEINAELFTLSQEEKIDTFLTSYCSHFEEIYTAISARACELHQKDEDATIQEISYLLPDNPDGFITRFPCNPRNPVNLTCLDTRDLARRVVQVPASKLRFVLDRICYNLEIIRDLPPEDLTWIENFNSALEENLKAIPPVARHIVMCVQSELENLLPAAKEEQGL